MAAQTEYQRGFMAGENSMRIRAIQFIAEIPTKATNQEEEK